MSRRVFKIGTVVQVGAGSKLVPAPANGIVTKVVRPRPYKGPKVDYIALRNDVTRGTKTRKQLLAIEASAARKAVRVL